MGVHFTHTRALSLGRDNSKVFLTDDCTSVAKQLHTHTLPSCPTWGQPQAVVIWAAQTNKQTHHEIENKRTNEHCCAAPTECAWTFLYAQVRLAFKKIKEREKTSGEKREKKKKRLAYFDPQIPFSASGGKWVFHAFFLFFFSFFRGMGLLLFLGFFTDRFITINNHFLTKVYEKALPFYVPRAFWS